MILHTTEELADFCREKLEKSGFSHPEIAEKIALKTGKKRFHPNYISKAVQKSEKNNGSRNGLRREILAVLGFEVESYFSVKRQKKT